MNSNEIRRAKKIYRKEEHIKNRKLRKNKYKNK